MIRQVFAGGPIGTNCFLVADHEGGAGAVIDAPEGVTERVVDQARTWGVTIQLLLSTHGHWDHIIDNAAILRATGARFGIHRDSEPLLTMPQARMFGLDFEIEPAVPDFYLQEGKTVTVGSLTFEVFDTPGHCPGSVVLFERSAGVVFAGDVLFAGSIGRSDFPGGDHELLLRSIREKLLPLADEVRVFPGHGPATTIGRERAGNPFLA